ncbi:dynein heavy chain 1, axonemal-like, partial [Ostrinia furnacalis]|uniref:dynein heavy chain 1, axonemal-like n=1 Tax=Ostrinia furnacalis TaxID=93504 RepID=UPI00103A816F
DYEVLDAFFMPLENDDFKALWEAIGWPLSITKQVDVTTEFLEEEQEKFWKLHQIDEQTMFDKIDMYSAQCMALTLQNDFAKVHEIANDIKKAWKGMKDSQEWGRILNQRQKLFGQPVIPFTDLNRLVKEFEPYRNLWVTASDFLKAREVWFDNPLMYVDADSIEPLINEYYKTIVKCVRTFADMPKVQQVATTIRDDIDEFRPLIPVIQAVRNPGMKERHWNEFMEKAGITVTMNEKQTFTMCLKQGMAAHGELIAEIGELASKEYVIEQSLDKMQGDWANKAMEIAPYKNTGECEACELASKEYVIEQSLDKMQGDWANKAMEIAPYKNTGECVSSEACELASKEYVIEQSLDKMQGDWANKAMEIAPYKNTGECVSSEACELASKEYVIEQSLDKMQGDWANKAMEIAPYKNTGECEACELASNEYVIEQSLDKMQGDWANKAMEIAPYKNTGTFIMKIADETLQLLDEHLLATQQLGFSPFKAAFELRITEWDEKLRLTQKVVDEWIECQKEWMYLEPIFTSEDISRQLPLEAKKYGTMERIWRRIMGTAAACPKLMLICPDSRLLDSLVEARHLLAVVARGLAEYMELKRLRFPRFFFLSDDELLEILSQSRNPRAVQPHLRKCFENIAK